MNATIGQQASSLDDSPLDALAPGPGAASPLGGASGSRRDAANANGFFSCLTPSVDTDICFAKDVDTEDASPLDVRVEKRGEVAAPKNAPTPATDWETEMVNIRSLAAGKSEEPSDASELLEEDAVQAASATEAGGGAPDFDPHLAERYHEMLTRGFYSRVRCRLLTNTKLTAPLFVDWVLALGTITLQMMALAAVWAAEWMQFAYQDEETFEFYAPTDYTGVFRENRGDGYWGSSAVIDKVPIFTLMPLLLVSYILSVQVTETCEEIMLGTFTLRYKFVRPPEAAGRWDFWARWTMAFILNSARFSLFIHFYTVTAQMIGLASGPLNIVMNSLSMVFIIEMDHMMTHDLAYCTIYSTRAERDCHFANTRAFTELATKLARIMEGVSARGQFAHRICGRTLELAYCGCLFTSARELQARTSRGIIIVADDGWSDEYDVSDRMTAIYNWTIVVMITGVLLYTNVAAVPMWVLEPTTRAATLARFTAYCLFDFLAFFCMFFIYNLYVIGSLAIFGTDAQQLPFFLNFCCTYTW